MMTEETVLDSAEQTPSAGDDRNVGGARNAREVDNTGNVGNGWGAPDAPKTLFDLMQDVWRGRFSVVFGAVLGGVVALLFIAMALPSFRAQMIIAPASPLNGAEVSSVLADDNLAAVRYLVQRSGVTNSSDFIHFQNTFYGPSVAELLLKDPAVIRGLKDDKAFTFSKAESDWDAARLSSYIQDNVRLESMGASALRRLYYRHPDAEFGTYFLQNIHRLSDELIRLKLKQEAGQRIRYLQQAVEETSNPDHKRALTTLLLEQERLLMLSSIGSPYAARIVEPPAALPRAVWPDKMLILPLFIALGALAGFIVFSVREGLEALRAAPYQRQRDDGETVQGGGAYAPREQRRYKPGKKYGYWWGMNHQNANESLGEGGQDNQGKAADER